MENQETLSVWKPQGPVKPATLGHWLKNVMRTAETDTNVFSAHSTRGAVTSKAKLAGVSTGDILKAANWSTTSMFLPNLPQASELQTVWLWGAKEKVNQKSSIGALQTLPCSVVN